MGKGLAADSQSLHTAATASFSLVGPLMRPPPLFARRERGRRTVAARTHGARLPSTGRERVARLLWSEADDMGRGSGTRRSLAARFCRLSLLPSVWPARMASPAAAAALSSYYMSPTTTRGNERERDGDGPLSLPPYISSLAMAEAWRHQSSVIGA
jgi:hypothetical protein